MFLLSLTRVLLRAHLLTINQATLDTVARSLLQLPVAQLVVRLALMEEPALILEPARTGELRSGGHHTPSSLHTKPCLSCSTMSYRSTCNLNDKGYIWCACQPGFSGQRCEVGSSTSGATTPQSCDNNGASSDLGACKNGCVRLVARTIAGNTGPTLTTVYRTHVGPNRSACKLNDKGYIYCDNCVGYSGVWVQIRTFHWLFSCSHTET